MKNENKGLALIKNTYKNFRFNFKSVIFFEILYKLIAIFIFIPINYFILNKFMGKIGVYNITNKELLKFGLTIEGIIYIGLIVLVSFIAVFIEISILTYMANKSHKKENVSLLEGTINAIRILPRRVSLYMISVVFISGVLGPITGIGLYNSLIRKLSIPSFVKIELFKSIGGKIVFCLFFIVIVVLLLRWILSIPAMVIENIKLKQSFKNSIKIYKNSKFKILGYIVSWVLINYLLKMILLGIFMGIGNIVILILGQNSIISGVFTVVAVTIFFIGYIIISVMTLPLFISFLVELYYKYRCYEVEEREFKPLAEYEDKKIYKFIDKNKNIFMLIILVIFSIMVGLMGISAVFDKVVDKDIKITAHRGSSLSSPENSLSSIKKAIEEKADYVEIDVMTTKDNEIVLFHDSTLKRIDGTNRVIGNITLEEVKAVDNGSYFSLEFKDEKIPTLKEVFDLTKGNIKINIELKPMKSNDTLPKEVAKLITEYNMEDEVVVSSLDYNTLQEFKKYNPIVDIGYILTLGVGDFTKLNVDFIAVEYQMLKKELIYAMHALGKEVHVWTINDSERAEEAMEIGVDNIITDTVELIGNTSKKLKEKKDINYLTWIYDGVISIIRYVQI